MKEKGHFDLSSTSSVPCPGLGLSRRAVAVRRRRFGVVEGNFERGYGRGPVGREIEAVQVIGVYSRPTSTKCLDDGQ